MLVDVPSRQRALTGAAAIAGEAKNSAIAAVVAIHWTVEARWLRERMTLELTIGRWCELALVKIISAEVTDDDSS